MPITDKLLYFSVEQTLVVADTNLFYSTNAYDTQRGNTNIIESAELPAFGAGNPIRFESLIEEAVAGGDRVSLSMFLYGNTVDTWPGTAKLLWETSFPIAAVQALSEKKPLFFIDLPGGEYLKGLRWIKAAYQWVGGTTAPTAGKITSYITTGM
jgi:hypothetical protein